jgi:hypothetical protein
MMCAHCPPPVTWVIDRGLSWPMKLLTVERLAAHPRPWLLLGVRAQQHLGTYRMKRCAFYVRDGHVWAQLTTLLESPRKTPERCTRHG